MKNCEHIIGFQYDYENSELITKEDLINSIKEAKISPYDDSIQRKTYELKDYADFRKSVNITRFRYCPTCGEKLNWKEICTIDTLLK